MNNSISFYQIFSAELFKTKNNLAKWVLLLFPFCFSALFFIFTFFEVETLPGNPWLFMGNRIFLFYAFFYPIVIALAVASFMNIEYKSSGFKHLFTIPTHLSYIYIAKIFVLFLTILSSTIIAYIAYKFGCILLQLSRPELNFQDYDSSVEINLFFLKLLITLVSIGLIQFVLSLKSSNFMISVGFALLITIVALLFNFKYSYLIPYKNIYTATEDFLLGDFTFFKKEVIVALIYIPAFFLAGGYIFLKKRQNER
jgi:hypothetical protein